MPEISIIMPCLNSAVYIAEALDSVLGQSFADFELIVIDAGSADGTLDILADYASKNKSMRVLHSEVKSLAAQCNIGMDSACGKYIGFLDSDDYIEPDMYEVLYNSIVNSTVDYVKANFDMFVDLPDGRLFFTYGPIAENQTDYYDRILAPEQMCELVRRDIFIWNGLYRRSFITDNHMRFQETPGAAFQDAGFVSQILMFAKSAMYLKNSFYRYRKGNLNASSASTRMHEFVMDEFRFVMERLNPDTKNLFIPAFLRRYFGSFHNCLRPYLLKNGCTDELISKVEPFRKLFLEQYYALPFPALSRSDLWPPQDLIGFISDFKKYCADSLARYKSDCEAHRKAAGYLAARNELVICGTGENAAGVYCYLTRCGLRNIVAFCADNCECGSYYGKDTLTAGQATSAYPGATYVITNSAGNKDAFKYKLLSCGVGIEQIVYYGDGLFHHNWHELPAE